MSTQPTTIREQIAVSYGNLARAHAGLERGARSYAVTDHMIRAKLISRLIDGTMKMRSLYDDERIKLTMPQACYYCGSTHHMCADHLVPKIRGGLDAGDNLIWARRQCNSSKGGRDMLEWMKAKGRFPPILLLRRYIKLVARYCEERGCLDWSLDRLNNEASMPVDVCMLPTKFPPLAQLTLWVHPPV